MSRLILTRGLPGSGKSTYALKWLSESPTTRCRINNDDLRASLFGIPKNDSSFDPTVEKVLRKLRFSLIRLCAESGKDVIVDNLNLSNKLIRGYQNLARELGIAFSVKDFSHIPIDVCIQRDSNREFSIGGNEIRKLQEVMRTNQGEFTSLNLSEPAS